MLTLQEWEWKYNINADYFPRPHPFFPCVAVPCPSPNHPSYCALWDLSDYVVTSVIAGTVWIRPRK